MKIFITGVAGFLGSHLADRMIALGHTVVGNDNLIGGYVSNIPLEVEFYKVDCCDTEKLSAIMVDCDVVYHCAATAHEGLSIFSPNFITKIYFRPALVLSLLPHKITLNDLSIVLVWHVMATKNILIKKRNPLCQ